MPPMRDENNANWHSAAKNVPRSPSPAKAFELSSPGTTRPMQSFDNFLSRDLGDVLMSAGKSETRLATPDQPQRRMYNARGTSPRRDLKGEHPMAQLRMQQPTIPKQQVLIRAQEEQNKHARAVAAASATAVEAAAAAAQAAAEIVRLTCARSPRLAADESIIRERAATTIQAAYRGHLARQALRALKGLVKLQAVIRGHLVRKQARITLRCMQALVRLQARVRGRQVKVMLESHMAKEQPLKQQPMRAQESYLRQQRKMPEVPGKQLLHVQESRSQHYRSETRWSNYHGAQFLDTSTSNSSQLDARNDDVIRDWDNSVFSRQELESRHQKRQNAAAMRQKALAYADTQQRAAGWKQPTGGGGWGRRADNYVESPREQMRSYNQRSSQRQAEAEKLGELQKFSFNETESDKVHRDWSWLEGWMSKQETSLWELQDESVGTAIAADQQLSSSSPKDGKNSEDEKIIEMDTAGPNFPRDRTKCYNTNTNTNHHNNYVNNHYFSPSSSPYVNQSRPPQRFSRLQPPPSPRLPPHTSHPPSPRLPPHTSHPPSPFPF